MSTVAPNLEALKASAPHEDALGVLCVDFGYCTTAQVQAALNRQRQLKNAGLQLSLGQILREQRLITAAQLRALLEYAHRNELARKRQSGANPTRPQIQRFGKYELLETLGEKDHARVFKANDTVLKRTVILRVLPPELLKDPQWRERYKRETTLLTQINHPNIVLSHGAETIEGAPTIVLEFVDGIPLNDRLDREGNVTEREAWLITREVLKGLAYAHHKGILHRDIKPSHIFCTSDGRIKITDYVLARSVYDDMGLTAQGTTVGTPFFISPEQGRGTDHLDARTDLYSLGCSTFQMLTGSVPFLGDGVGETMIMHSRAPRPDPRELLPEISEGSVNLVQWMMAVNPDDRPAHAEDILAEIEKLLPSLADSHGAVRPMYQISASESVASDVELLASPVIPSPNRPVTRTIPIRGGTTITTKPAAGASGFWSRMWEKLNGLLGGK